MIEGIARTRLVWRAQAIRIAAQQRLEPFYTSLGFRTVSAPYNEDDIVHVDMRLDAARWRYDAAHRSPRLTHEADLSRFRTADRRAPGEDRRAALRPRGLRGRHLRRDQPAAEEEPAAHQGDLRQAHRVADRDGRAPSAAALHARLHQRPLQRIPRAARRSQLRRRRGDRRRSGALQRQAVHGDRPPEGPRHQGEDPPQLRDAAPRGLPQGAAAHEARREIRAAALHVRRHARRLSRDRRRRARPVRGDRPQPLRNGRIARADRRHGHRRRRLGRRARDRDRRRHADAPVRDLLGHLARGLRVDPVEIGRAGARGRRDARHHRAAPEAAGPDRQGRQRAAGRRAPRPGRDDGDAEEGADRSAARAAGAAARHAARDARGQDPRPTASTRRSPPADRGAGAGRPQAPSAGADGATARDAVDRAVLRRRPRRARRRHSAARATAPPRHASPSRSPGGRDSMVLLDALARLAPELRRRALRGARPSRPVAERRRVGRVLRGRVREARRAARGASRARRACAAARVSKPRRARRATRRSPRSTPTSSRSRTTPTTRPRRCCCNCCAARVRTASRRCRALRPTPSGPTLLRPFLALPRAAIDAYAELARARVGRRRIEREHRRQAQFHPARNRRPPRGGVSRLSGDARAQRRAPGRSRVRSSTNSPRSTRERRSSATPRQARRSTAAR